MNGGKKRRRSHKADERGQAFTLEGLIAAIVLLTAVLFALQAVVITPTTGGSVDRGVQAQVDQQLTDAMLVGAEDGNFSELVRYYSATNQSADCSWNQTECWYQETPGNESVYNSSTFAGELDFVVGDILDEHFVNQSGKSYNVEFIYYDADGENRTTKDVVRMGGARADGAVTASYMVVLHEGQYLTAPDSDDVPIDDEDNHSYPIPNVSEEDAFYNIVEVRVTVW